MAAGPKTADSSRDMFDTRTGSSAAAASARRAVCWVLWPAIRGSTRVILLSVTARPGWVPFREILSMDMIAYLGPSDGLVDDRGDNLSRVGRNHPTADLYGAIVLH